MQDERRFIFTAADAARLTFEAAVAVVAASEDATGPATIATVKGYPIVWNVLSTDRGGFFVRLVPKSARFTKNVLALNHHDRIGGPLGDLESETLRILPADAYGVPVEIDLPNTTLGRDTLELIRTRRMRGMSFAMMRKPVGRKTFEGGKEIVNAEGYDVDEVTITCDPAFNGTTLELKRDETAAAAGTFAARTSQSLALQRFKLDFHRQAGAELPH